MPKRHERFFQKYGFSYINHTLCDMLFLGDRKRLRQVVASYGKCAYKLFGTDDWHDCQELVKVGFEELHYCIWRSADSKMSLLIHPDFEHPYAAPVGPPIVRLVLIHWWDL